MRCRVLAATIVALALGGASLSGQNRPLPQPQLGGCGSASNPCKPSAYVTPWGGASLTLAPESGPQTYTATITNNGTDGGDYSLSCTEDTEQALCSVSPSTFHLNQFEQQSLTITVTPLGLGTYADTLRINGYADDMPGKTVVDYHGAVKVGSITIAGTAIVQHVWPTDEGNAATLDTLVASFYHASGINQGQTKLWIDGKDSTSKLTGHQTASGYKVAMVTSSGYHTWTSYVCANSGRCDTYTTHFSAQGPASFALDDSLPPTVNPLNTSGTLLGPLNPPGTDSLGCTVAAGGPEISFVYPTSFLTQSSPYGRVFVATVDTSHPYLTITTQTLAWTAGSSKTCAETSLLPRSQFNWDYFAALSPSDPHWNSYPWGDLSYGPPPAPEWFGAGTMEYALGPTWRHGPNPPLRPLTPAEMAPPPLLRRQPSLAPTPPLARTMPVPDPGPIDSLSWKVWLNGVQVINNSQAVSGSGVIGIIPGRLNQTAQIPTSHTAFHTSTYGGWNELVASIRDTLGNVTTIRMRFVHDAPSAAGNPSSIAVTPQRNFIHLNQGDCAAFGAFQCEGITLAMGIPGFVTRDKARDLHLVYRSASQKVRTTIPLRLDIAKTQRAPDSLWIRPYLNGTLDANRTLRYAGSKGTVTGPNATNIYEDKDEVRIVATEVDSAPGQAAIRTVRHLVHGWYPVTPFQVDDTVSQDVVQLYLTDSTSTRFGQGWQLAELNRLVFTGASGVLKYQGDTTAVWVGGDGSYSVFRRQAGSWVAPPGETARLVKLGSAQADGTLYILYLETGASLGFRADGWQLWTKDLLGNATTYAYPSATSTRLDSITDPTHKALVFTYYGAGKRKGMAQEIRVRRSATATDTITVAKFDYDTVTNTTAARLSRFMILQSAQSIDTTRFTYKTSAPGAFLDSLIDPRHTAARPVVTRFAWDPELWTPVSVTRPLGGIAQARQIWRRASPRVGYGRWGHTPQDPLERTLQSTQWIGTSVPFAGLAADYQVDPFGGPTYVLDGPSVYSGLLGTNSGSVRYIVRDTVGRPTRIVKNRYDPATADSVMYQYDALGRVTRLIRTTLELPDTATGREVDTLSFTYDTVALVANANWCSRLRSSTDAFGSATTVDYYGSGNARCLPYHIVGPAADSTTFYYGNNGNPQAGQVYGTRPVKVKDPNGNADSVAYHSATWNTEYLVQPGNVVTRSYYDVYGRADSILDPAGKVSWTIRERTGRVRFAGTGKSTQVPFTRTTYDRGGLVTEVAVFPGTTDIDTTVPSSAQKTTNYYDQLGRLDSIVNPGGRGISSTGFKARKQSWATRDAFGNPRWEYPGNGSYVARIYDERGSVTRIDESQVYPGFSADGERFADTAASHWWTALQLPTGRVQSSGVIHQMTYDEQGRLATSASRDPFRPESSYVNQTYTYTRTGQVRSERLFLNDVGSASVVRWYYYNRRGQRTAVVDTVGASGVTAEKVGYLKYEYNATTGRLDSLMGSVGGTQYSRVRYYYDKGGRDTLRVVTPTGTQAIAFRTTTVYDALNRVAAITTSSTQGTHYSMGNNNCGSSIYNLAGDLVCYSSSEPGASSGTHNYGYSTDGTRRLITATEGYLGNSWSYDALGNRLTDYSTTNIAGDPPSCINTYTSVYDGDNRLMRRYPAGGPTGSCPGAKYFTDQAGRRIGEADTTAYNAPNTPPLFGLKSITTYTAAGRLYYSLTPSGNLSQNDMNWHWYDAQGRKVMSQLASLNYISPFPSPDSVGGYRTYYIYDGSDIALELVRSGSSWTVDRRFLTGGVDRQLAARLNIGGTYHNVTFVADRAGSIVRAMEPNGTEVNNAAYFPRNAFGALAGMTGSGGSPLGGVGYAGASTPNARGGFVYLRNRWYDPQTGRFLTQDPIGLAGGVNLYAYAGNNPIAFDDPFGLDPCKGSRAWTECLAQGLANWGASRGGGAGTAALWAGAIANAGLEVTGVNFAAAAGDKIGSGDISGGARDAALLLGGIKVAGAILGRVVAAAEGTILGRSIGALGDGSPRVTTEQIVQAVADAGATVKPHPTRGGQGVAILFPDGTNVDIRVETHPLTRGGQPLLHGNVEVWGADGSYSNSHVTP